ncbi:MAG: SDR family NAD(P)-dependent oxidoreductase [Chloroflexota bacterium]|nr:SDR family NAD(P)-dependent oxidoreductase [Chloroflexota bacterium]
MRLKDKVALITGAGRGIGQAIAMAYAREGAIIALAARSLDQLEETAKQAAALGAQTSIVRVDVTSQAEVEAMAAETRQRFGRVDILVNNAGIVGPIGALEDNDVESWVRTIQVNLVGTYLCCRSVIPIMAEAGGGRIINLSGSGSTSAPHYLSAYGSSKAAIIRLTEILSLELADKNIQVNALGPGSIHTGMWEEITDGAQAAGETELYEFGLQVTGGGGASIERAAELAVWLASDAADGLSGRLIHAVADDFPSLTPLIPEIMASDLYTLRRDEP